MLKGKTLVELAQAVQDQANRKMDVVADTRSVGFQVLPQGGASLVIDAKDGPIQAAVTSHALSQITTHTGIPAAYAQRMLSEAPELMERNVNHWLQHKPTKRMVRTVREETGTIARAFLSDRYHRMENDQLLATVLPELHGNAAVEIMSTELTASRMFIKVVFPRLQGEVKRGDLVQYGFTLSNSEIGSGAMAVEPFIYRLVCLNGLTLSKEVDDKRMRRAHLGRVVEEGVDYFTEETVRADDKALQLKLRDTLRAFTDEDRWQQVLARMQRAADTEAAADPIAAVERVAEVLALPKPESNLVLQNFLRDGDFTKWGMVNAVTAVANVAESYDRASELEKFGGRVLDLDGTQWRRLAAAA
jgi:hypothetical protein